VKIKVPTVNQIGSLKYPVSFVSHMRTDDGWKGSLNERTGVIHIETEISGNMRDRTYLHEIVHQIDINYEIGLSEENISRIANGFCEYLNNLGIELDWSNIK